MQMTPDTNFWLQCADVYRHPPPTPPHPTQLWQSSGTMVGVSGQHPNLLFYFTFRILQSILGVPIILKVFEMVKGVEPCQGQNVQKTGRENVSFSLERRPRD